MLLIDEGPRHSSRMCPATSSNVSDAPSSVESKYARRVAESSDADSGIEESDAAPRTAPKLKLTAVPDLNGVRFCRVCREFLPTGMFPRGQRRFTCRPHIWQRIGKKSRKALLAHPRKRLLASIWIQCYKDGRLLGLSLELTQADVGRMLDTLEAAGSDPATPGTPGADDVAVLPKDLSSPISTGNAVLVAKAARRALLDKLRRGRRLLAATRLGCREGAAEACRELGSPCREACREQQNQLVSSWRKEIESASLIPPEDDIFGHLAQIEVLPDA
jgi:hypothetical protein